MNSKIVFSLFSLALLSSLVYSFSFPLSSDLQAGLKSNGIGSIQVSQLNDRVFLSDNKSFSTSFVVPSSKVSLVCKDIFVNSFKQVENDSFILVKDVVFDKKSGNFSFVNKTFEISGFSFVPYQVKSKNCFLSSVNLTAQENQDFIQSSTLSLLNRFFVKPKVLVVNPSPVPIGSIATNVKTVK